jgi:hypothetical protein
MDSATGLRISGVVLGVGVCTDGANFVQELFGWFCDVRGEHGRGELDESGESVSAATCVPCIVSVRLSRTSSIYSSRAETHTCSGTFNCGRSSPFRCRSPVFEDKTRSKGEFGPPGTCLTQGIHDFG